MAEQILIGAIALAIIAAISGFFATIIYLVRKSRRDPFLPYPFDDPDYIHVGITPRQAEALKPLALELRFMQWIPRHENQAVDATYYAMTREEFITFFAVVTKHTRLLIAKASREAMVNKAVILDGDTFALSEMLIGLTVLRQKLSPEPLPEELQIQLQGSVDRLPAAP